MTIPRLYGHYHIVLSERESPRYQVVYVVLLENVDGTPLNKFPIPQLSDDDAKSLWDKVRSILIAVHNEGIVHRLPKLHKWIWRKDHSTDEMVWIDFSFSKVLDEMDEEHKGSLRDADRFDLLHVFDRALNAVGA
jgi:serine/threonine protein kinase